MGFYWLFRKEEVEEELENELVPILEEDDTEKFNKFIEEDYKEKVKDTITCCMILDLCLCKGAKKCSVAFFKHPIPKEIDILFYFNPNLLYHIATVWEDPQVLEDMFQHSRADYLANQTYVNILPIHDILLEIMTSDPFSNWYKGDSLIKLIIMLMSTPKARPRLECARLVAENTSSIKQVALDFFHNGDVKELAALLLLADDDLFLSFKKDLPTVSHDCLPTISSAYMVSQAVHGDIPDVYALVYLFYKAARDLRYLYTSMPQDVNPADMILKVASLFKNAGFPINYKDVDVERKYSRCGVTDSICQALGAESYNGINFSNKKLRFPSVYCIPFRTSTDNDDGKYFGHRRHDDLFRKKQVRQYSSASQNHKISANKVAQSSLSVRNVAFLAMRLRRGIRFL